MESNQEAAKQNMASAFTHQLSQVHNLPPTQVCKHAHLKKKLRKSKSDFSYHSIYLIKNSTLGKQVRFLTYENYLLKQKYTCS